MIKALKFILKILISLIVASLLWVLVYSVVYVPITPYQFIEYISGNNINKDWVSYEEVSPNLYRAVIAAEDARFYEHFGVDWKAVDEAERYNKRYPHKRRRGASTITMQTAKNTFLWHGRTYIRKALEVYFSYLIEIVWGKKRILEVYVNVIEWGDGIYGVEFASQKYFRKSANKLTKREAALLAAVLPNPKRWNPAAPTNYINRRASTIMARMNSIKIEE